MAHEVFKDDFYAILELAPSADAHAIKKSYHRLALKRHPDKNSNSPHATAAFQLLQLAYSVLSNPTTRWNYDAQYHDIQRQQACQQQQKQSRQQQQPKQSQQQQQQQPPPNPDSLESLTAQVHEAEQYYNRLFAEKKALRSRLERINSRIDILEYRFESTSQELKRLNQEARHDDHDYDVASLYCLFRGDSVETLRRLERRRARRDVDCLYLRTELFDVERKLEEWTQEQRSVEDILARNAADTSRCLRDMKKAEARRRAEQDRQAEERRQAEEDKRSKQESANREREQQAEAEQARDDDPEKQMERKLARKKTLQKIKDIKGKKTAMSRNMLQDIIDGKPSDPRLSEKYIKMVAELRMLEVELEQLEPKKEKLSTEPSKKRKRESGGEDEDGHKGKKGASGER